MKFSIDKETIFRQLSFVAAVIPNRNVMSVLTTVNMRLDNGMLYLKASNLVDSRFANCRVDSEGDGVANVEGKYLMGVVGKVSGKLTFYLQNNSMVINSDNGVFQVPVQVGEYPNEDLGNMDNSLYFGADFLESLSSLSSLVVKDPIRPQISGVRLDTSASSLVVLDFHRSAVLSVNFEGDVNEEGFTFSNEFVNGLEAMGGESFKLIYSNKVIKANGEGRSISGRLLEGKFPNYYPIFGSNLPRSLTVDADELLAATQLVMVCADPNNLLVSLNIDKNKLTLNASDEMLGSSGSQEVTCVSGSVGVVKVSARYMSDILRKYKGYNIKIEFGEPNEPLRISGGLGLTSIIASMS